MPLVSILTTEYAPSARYVDETVRAVEQLKLPDGWELEWVVQEDGAAPGLADRYGAVAVVRYAANGAQLASPPPAISACPASPVTWCRCWTTTTCCCRTR